MQEGSVALVSMAAVRQLLLHDGPLSLASQVVIVLVHLLKPMDCVSVPEPLDLCWQLSSRAVCAMKQN